MKLDLKIINDEIYVKCEVIVTKDHYSFALLHTLQATQFKNNDRYVNSICKEECSMKFQPPMIKYTFQDLQEGVLSFEYCGKLEGPFLFMQEELIHMSYYNGWYPIGYDVIEEYDITVHCDSSYELIHGQFDKEENVWFYTTRHQTIVDCNIILINKSQALSYINEKVHIYYFDENHKEYMQKYFDRYISVYEYYVSLYENDKIGFNSIVFLPEKYQFGAYKRDHLIVFSEFEKDLHTLAHEIAHAYASGANVNSWEDWLNETHAEWSALLYEEEHNLSYFEHLLKERYRGYKGNYKLNALSDQRPDDVHETGTLIYYEIYKKYGKDAIKTLLKIFDQLENKNTDSFLRQLMIENKRLAEEIQMRLK